jgi:superfamily II DNA helicase RecQ
MSTNKPMTRNEFLNITGVGQFKLEEFGDEFIEAILKHCGVESQVSDNYSQLDLPLFNELKNLRNTLARERGLPAYCIFNNDTLKEMATVKPITKTQLLRINGVGEVKMNDFGDSFIRCIKENV